MAVISKGYAGQIQANQDWAGMQNGLGRRMWCESATSWQVTTQANSLTVQVKTGACGAWGVRNLSDAVQSLALPASPGSTTWYLVVARYSWGTTQQTSLAYINVGSTPAITGQNNDPGVLFDQPLALVPVTGSVAGTPRDVRLVGVADGINIAFDDLVRTYASWPGIKIRIGSKEWFRGTTVTGSNTWESTDIGMEVVSGAAMFAPDGNWAIKPRATNAQPYAGNRMLRVGNRVEYDIVARLATPFHVDTDKYGLQTPPRKIGTLSRYKPDTDIPTTFWLRGGIESNEYDQFGGHGIINPSGGLFLLSTLPEHYIYNSSQDDPATLRCHVEFTKETI